MRRGSEKQKEIIKVTRCYHFGVKLGSRLKDKVVIVTGSGAGIGKTIAIAFAREGAHIVGADKQFEKLQDTGKEVEHLGRRFLAVRCDVSKKEDCQKVVRETLNELGRVDILVNNAAIYPITPFLEITPEEWDEVLAVNLRGSMLMSQAVLPHMIEKRRGKIIMVNSNQIRYSPPVYLHVHYVASKMGILALTRCLAAEFGPSGIQVNGFAPGYTPGTEQALRFVAPVLTPEYEKQRLSRIPLGRLGRVEDYEGIAVFLASEESDYITGQTVSVDGGITMQG